MKSKLKEIFGLSSVILLAVLLCVLFFIPVSREKTEFEDISVNHKVNTYEITIKRIDKTITISDKDIKTIYVNGYVSKSGRKAYLEQTETKHIIGTNIKYTLVIVEGIS